MGFRTSTGSQASLSKLILPVLPLLCESTEALRKSRLTTSLHCWTQLGRLKPRCSRLPLSQIMCRLRANRSQLYFIPWRFLAKRRGEVRQILDINSEMFVVVSRQLVKRHGVLQV